MRLGILGGTFDPPHIAHLVLAQEAQVQLALDHVLFVPAGQPPHKSWTPMWTAEERAQMVARAIAGNPAFALSRLDIDRPGPHYTVDLLALVQAEWPVVELFFLMGADEFRSLPTWRQPLDVLRQTHLAVMRRPAIELDLDALERQLPGLAQRTVWIDTPLLDISSTDLRRRIQSGLPVRYLVPDPVWQWLVEWKTRQLQKL